MLMVSTMNPWVRTTRCHVPQNDSTRKRGAVETRTDSPPSIVEADGGTWTLGQPAKRTPGAGESLQEDKRQVQVFKRETASILGAICIYR